MPLTRWRTIADTAAATGRPHRTIRTWARQHRIPTERRDGHLYVDIVEAARLSEQASRRNRTSRR